ncbi:hypothetical protein HOH45_05675, partial [bacterium]|nr:hypothetical protein [bacterium]
MEILRTLAISYTAITMDGTPTNRATTCPGHNINNIHDMLAEKMSPCLSSDVCDNFFRATVGIVNNGNACGDSKYTPQEVESMGNNYKHGSITYNSINKDIRTGKPLTGYKLATVNALQNIPEFIQELSLGREGNLEGTYYRALGFNLNLPDYLSEKGKNIELKEIGCLSEGALSSIFANDAHNSPQGLFIEEYVGGGSIPTSRLGLSHPGVREALNPPSNWTIDQSVTSQNVMCREVGMSYFSFDQSSFDASKITTRRPDNSNELEIMESPLFQCSNTDNSLSFLIAS